MLQVGRLAREHFLTVCEQTGLSPAQAHALQAITPDQPLAMSELAGRLRCDASNVTGLADRLEDAGLVERRQDPHDRRRKNLVLTDHGRALRDELTAALNRPPDDVAAAIDQRETQLRRTLSAVVAETEN